MRLHLTNPSTRQAVEDSSSSALAHLRSAQSTLGLRNDLIRPSSGDRTALPSSLVAISKLSIARTRKRENQLEINGKPPKIR